MLEPAPPPPATASAPRRPPLRHQRSRLDALHSEEVAGEVGARGRGAGGQRYLKGHEEGDINDAYPASVDPHDALLLQRRRPPVISPDLPRS